MTGRPALGRGLSALIPRRADSSDAADAPPTTLPIASITPNPDQPRQLIEGGALEELAASIRQHGVLQPLLVTQAQDGGYIIVAGERRWRAAQLAGLNEVPVVVSETAAPDRLTLALVENIQREDLSPLEEAHAYERLTGEAGLSQEQVAQRVGKSRTTIANAMRLLQLPTPVRMSLAAGEISAGHARAILGAPSTEQQIRLWERVKAQTWNVRQTETAAQRLRHAERPPTAPRPTLPGDRLAEERLQVALGTQVTVERGRRGGRLVIRWYDDEQLEQIVSTITAAATDPTPPIPDRIDI